MKFGDFNTLQKTVFALIIFILGVNIYYTFGVPKGYNTLNRNDIFDNIYTSGYHPIELGKYNIKLFDYTRSFSDLEEYQGIKHTLKIDIYDKGNKRIYSNKKIQLPTIQAKNNTEVYNLHFEQDTFDTYLIFYTPYIGSKYLAITDELGQEVIVDLNPLLIITSSFLLIPILIILACVAIFYRGTYEMFAALTIGLLINFFTKDMVWGSLLFLAILTVILRLRLSNYHYKVNTTLLICVGIGTFLGILCLIFIANDNSFSRQDILSIILMSLIVGGLAVSMVLGACSIWLYIKVFLYYPEQKINSIATSNYKSTKGRYASYYLDMIVNNNEHIKQIEVSYTSFQHLKRQEYYIISRYKTDGKGTYVFY